MLFWCRLSARTELLCPPVFPSLRFTLFNTCMRDARAHCSTRCGTEMVVRYRRVDRFLFPNCPLLLIYLSDVGRYATEILPKSKNTSAVLRQSPCAIRTVELFMGLNAVNPVGSKSRRSNASTLLVRGPTTQKFTPPYSPNALVRLFGCLLNTFLVAYPCRPCASVTF